MQKAFLLWESFLFFKN